MTVFIQGQSVTFTQIAPPGASQVQVGLSQSSTSAPSTLVTAFVSNGSFTATLTPEFSGAGFLWVYAYAVAKPQVSLRISYDKGRTFGNAVPQSVGAQGEYLVAPSWRRLGLGRDVVFQLEWSFAGETALNGAFVDLEELNT
jgi:hypothetical protein